MTWIARTDGATSGAPTDIRNTDLGLLAVPAAQRANWREVVMQTPAHDAVVERVLLGNPALVINGNGTVTAQWTTLAHDPLVAKVLLVEYAERVAKERREDRSITLGTSQLATSQATVTGLLDSLDMLERGYVATVHVSTAAGDRLTPTVGQIGTALNAIADYRESVDAALDSVIAAIRAGSITSKAGVDGASWPA